MLRIGDQGDKVRILQYFLGVLSQYYDTIPFVDYDGIFGEKTLDAVNAFQREFGLPQTGVVGPQTWEAMYNAVMGIENNDIVRQYDSQIRNIIFGDKNFNSVNLSYGSSDFDENGGGTSET